MHYDPMIAKLVAHGRNRTEAIEKMKRALREYKINGVKTTIPFCEIVLSHPEFINGSYDINFVAKHFLVSDPLLEKEESIAIAASFVTSSADVRKISLNNKIVVSQTQWKNQLRNE